MSDAVELEVLKCPECGSTEYIIITKHLKKKSGEIWGSVTFACLKCDNVFEKRYNQKITEIESKKEVDSRYD